MHFYFNQVGLEYTYVGSGTVAEDTSSDFECQIPL